MSKYSLTEFVNQTQQQDKGEGMFELETPRMLEINLNGQVWTKMGSMISYRGDIKFAREKCLNTDLGKCSKKLLLVKELHL